MRLSLLEALALGPERWDRVVSSSPRPSPFMRWAWHRAWAAAAPAHEVERAFVILGRRHDGEIQVLLPLRLQRTRFRRAPVTALVWAIGNVGSPDHLHVPAVPGASLRAVTPMLEQLPWDVMALRSVANEPDGVAPLAEAFDHRGLQVSRRPMDACPYLDLPDDWEAYLARCSAVRRATIRRKERALARAHDVALTDYLPDRFEEGWQRLLSLHRQRFPDGGVFANPRVDRQLRRFTSELAASGDVWLTTLDVDGEPAAAWYGFAWHDTVYFYQGGRDPRWESVSVGYVLGTMMIRRAIERGYRRFDFLRGREAYKLSWTSTERLISEVAFFRRGLRGTVLRGLDVLGRRTRGRLIETAPIAAETDG